jgi:pimeloyl-ACP methyl ester carboxylesterase
MMKSVYESALRSKYAYMEPDEIHKSIPDAEFISSEEEDTQVYFWRGDDNTVYITFRGTSSLKDAMIDLNLSRYRIKNKIKVHEGFYTQFKSVELELTKRLLKSDDATKIVFAGHSLGGALAQIAAAYYGEIFDFSYVACHTFGSPRVGNSHFVEWFEKNVDENVRVVNKRDPIPMVPTLHYWKHTMNRQFVLCPDGTIREPQDDVPWYKRLYKLASGSKVHDHDCDLYLKNLEKHV